ncbi:MAG: hypothetical protein LBM27_06260 [Lactobacillaceae bacterium]|jgi:hypothetical protein|nr:hypothetical protein [Lactobacillaceae bacterium]
MVTIPLSIIVVILMALSLTTVILAHIKTKSDSSFSYVIFSLFAIANATLTLILPWFADSITEVTTKLGMLYSFVFSSSITIGFSLFTFITILYIASKAIKQYNSQMKQSDIEPFFISTGVMGASTVSYLIIIVAWMQFFISAYSGWFMHYFHLVGGLWNLWVLIPLLFPFYGAYKFYPWFGKWMLQLVGVKVVKDQPEKQPEPTGKNYINRHEYKPYFVDGVYKDQNGNDLDISNMSNKDIVLEYWGNTYYVISTGDSNFDNVPKRVWDNWYKKMAVYKGDTPQEKWAELRNDFETHGFH